MVGPKTATGARRVGQASRLWLLALVSAAGCTGNIGSRPGVEGDPLGPGTGASIGPDPGAGSSADPGTLPGGTAGAGGMLDPNALPPDDAMPTELPFEPPAAALRRLTAEQYANTVRSLLGSVVLNVELEADTAISGFIAIGSARATISPSALEKYETAAFDLAQQALVPERRDELVGCVPGGVIDTACTTAFVTRFGRNAFRRPLTSDEIDRYVTVAENAAETLDDFHAGIEFALAGLLQSPNFLFRAELGTPDPDRDTLVRYDGYELASRLSYLLLSTTPDERMLDAAEAGVLDTLAGLTTQLDRLMVDPRVREAMSTFHAERLGLEAGTPDKDPDLFPAMTDSLAAAMRQDVLLTFDDLAFSRDVDFRDAFTTRVSFVDEELAALYDLPMPNAAGMSRVELPADSLRVGLLGKAALLAKNAHVTATSPSLRGKFVRERVLCQTIAAPPNNVVTVLPEPDPDAPTMRDRLEVHRTNTVCASCHSLMDPIGLAFENFDAIGQYREDDDGNALDVSGDLDGDAFAGPVELAELISRRDDATECVVRHLYRYAVAHVETRGERPVIDALVQSFADADYRLQQLLRAVVLSEGFRYAGRSEP